MQFPEEHQQGNTIKCSLLKKNSSSDFNKLWINVIIKIKLRNIYIFINVRLHIKG